MLTRFLPETQRIKNVPKSLYHAKTKLRNHTIRHVFGHKIWKIKRKILQVDEHFTKATRKNGIKIVKIGKTILSTTPKKRQN